MINIVVDSTRARITGLARSTLTAVRDATSYARRGAEFAQRAIPSWKRSTKTDNRVPLLRLASDGKSWTLPAGLVWEAERAIRLAGGSCEIEDRRPPLPRAGEFGFDGGLRDYQIEAGRAFTTGAGDAAVAGRGILKHSVRSGKTRTAARIISAYGVPAVFLVTSQILLRQAERVLRELLPDARVTVVGEGRRDTSGDVVVCTLHSLVKARERRDAVWKDLSARPLIVMDECHHLEGAERWVAALLHCSARIRLGLSATVWLSSSEEPEPEDVLLKAVTGPVLHEVTMADLMARKFLVPCMVRMPRVYEPRRWRGRSAWWSKELHDECVFDNEARNGILVDSARRALDEGYRSLIITTSRIGHAHKLTEALTDAGILATFMVGSHGDDQRQRVIDKLRDHRLDAVVSTVLGEGVDIPECESVIVGEGGKSRRAALQRMRCLTPAPGKTRSLLVDVLDLTNTYFAEHAKERLRAYKAERCFSFDLPASGA